MTKLIQQIPGSKDCLACVAAMATQTKPFDYKLFCDRRKIPRDHDLSFIRYCWENGYAVGSYFSQDGIHGKHDLKDMRNVDLLYGSSYIVVESKNQWAKDQGGCHAVYWNGKRIYDPAHDESQTIDDYKVIAIFAITKNLSHERWKQSH